MATQGQLMRRYIYAFNLSQILPLGSHLWLQGSQQCMQEHSMKSLLMDEELQSKM